MENIELWGNLQNLILYPERKTVVTLDFRSKFGLNIIAIENSGTVTEIISPSYTFRRNDILYLVGSKDGLFKFNEWIEK